MRLRPRAAWAAREAYMHRTHLPLPLPLPLPQPARPRAPRDPHGSGFDPTSLGLRPDFRLTDFSKLKG